MQSAVVRERRGRSRAARKITTGEFWQVFSFFARRAGSAILGRRFRRERRILILGAIVEANSRPQQDDLRWLTVDEGRVEHRLTMDCDAQAGHQSPICGPRVGCRGEISTRPTDDGSVKEVFTALRIRSL